MSEKFQAGEVIDCVRAKVPDLQALYLFGSVATDQAGHDSDIDFALWGESPVAPPLLWAISNEIAAIVKCDVDLVDLSAASAVMRIQIIAHGKRLYCANEFRCAVFEDFTFSDYARLNEERAGILSDIRDRGSVYG